MNIVFIGNCGHSMEALGQMKEHPEARFVGAAAGDFHEDAGSIERFGAPVFASWQEMLDQTNPHVAVVSPVFGLTGQIIIECAKRRIDVFAEKPIAASLEELKAVRKAVEESGIHFSAMHFLRFLPAFYEAAYLVRQGAVGKVRLITAQKSYRFGVRPGWYGERKLYTGTIPWVGIHAMDWMDACLDVPFRSVSALQMGSPEKTALCQFEMEGGILASANIDYLRPEEAPSHGDDRLRVAGDAGVLEVRDGTVILMDSKGVREYRPKTAPKLALDFLWGKEELSLASVFRVTEAALMARDAADEGRKKEFDLK